MREQLERRLGELRTEYGAGTRALRELEEKQAELRGVLIRISGAIQVLEELLGQDGDPPAELDARDEP